jgi:DNA-binding protein
MDAPEQLADCALDVCGKSTLEYVAESLARFNRGADEVILRSVAGNASKAMQVARILSEGFGIESIAAKLCKLEINELNTPCLELFLKFTVAPKDIGKAGYSTESNFIEFPIYHLLLDSLLAKNGTLGIFRHDDARLATVVKSKWGISCKGNAEQDVESLNELTSAYYRSGLLLSPYWSRIAQKLSEFDDIILGIDTNILYNAGISEQLLSSLSLIDSKEHVHTPNWLLIVIPSAVMHEIEQATNSRDKRGFLRHAGRMGFRALQEILELDQSTDLMGVSLLIVGEADPALDTRVELRGLREDLAKSAPPSVHSLLSAKVSSGDTIIRDQFKHFLQHINFHKGAFFLSADKSNVALAKTEGLRPIYQKIPPWQVSRRVIDPPRILCKPEPEIVLTVPLGKLIYELAVQFGSIKIRWAAEEIEVACDAKGESLDHWLCRELRIESRDDLKKLLRHYEAVGKVSLEQVKKVWDTIIEEITGGDIG